MTGRGVLKDKRIRVVVGHYGSGKTEFAVNYALALAKEGQPVTICDLDIVNPYFRTREVAAMLEERGVRVISGARGHDANLDIPMLSAGILAPLQDREMNAVLDVGGDDVGARVLAYYREYFTPESCDLFFVVNAYREQTRDVESAYLYLRRIEDTIGFRVTGLISNTHLLRETKSEDIEAGINLAGELSKRSRVPVRYYTGIASALRGVEPARTEAEPFEIAMHLRTRWQ